MCKARMHSITIAFNSYSESMSIILNSWKGGIVVANRKMTKLRYDDDRVIVTRNVKELQEIANKLCQENTRKQPLP